MGKSGREGIGAGKWHSPMDGQVREGGNQSERASGTHQRMGKGGRDQSEQGHSPRMGKSGREGIGVSEWHSPMDGQVREGGNQSKQASGTHQRMGRGGRELEQARALTNWKVQTDGQ